MKENIKIMKLVIKIILSITLIVSYFINLIVMFNAKPLDILIANILIWLLVIIIPLGMLFVDWLNEKDSDD